LYVHVRASPSSCPSLDVTSWQSLEWSYKQPALLSLAWSLLLLGQWRSGAMESDDFLKEQKSVAGSYWHVISCFSLILLRAPFLPCVFSLAPLWCENPLRLRLHVLARKNLPGACHGTYRGT